MHIAREKQEQIPCGHRGRASDSLVSGFSPLVGPAIFPAFRLYVLTANSLISLKLDLSGILLFANTMNPE